MKASIKEVAKLAGVSVATVSHVLNKTKKVLPQTEKRVMDAVDILHYQINPLARNLRRGESKIVGFVVSDLTSYHFIDIARGVEKVLRQFGYHTLIVDSKEDKSREIDNAKDLISMSVDGLIIAPTVEDCSYLRTLIQRDLPVAFVDRKPQNYEGDVVLSTNIKGAYDAVSYMVSKGHKKIGFIGSRFDTTMEERLSGYKKALTEAGIKVDNNYLRFGEGHPLDVARLRHGNNYYLMEELFEETDITAIFTGNNLSCAGAFMYLREKNIDVPGRMAFATYDDSFWLTTSTPALTAIAQNPERIGQEAAEILLKRLQGLTPESFPYQNIRVETEMILRESV
ncbi:MAG: LacI family transcriptional regulator [Spirochaetia bacterium]|nr:LacI family transcriptional regulator [Spirochaetia bacterium]